MTKNVLIIGGGLVGLAIAREVAQLADYDVYLTEKESNLGEHASGRNNGVNHSGIYYPKDSLKARLCVLGNRLNQQYFPQWNVPLATTGKYIVALDNKEDFILEDLIQRGIDNGIPGLSKLSGAEVKEDDLKHQRKGEPNIRCYSAIHIPTAGIFDGATYIQTLQRLAKDSGVHIVKNTEIVGIERKAQQFTITTRETRKRQEHSTEEQADFDLIINAAGTWSAKIAKMVNPDSEYEIVPVRGEGACFYQTRLDLMVYSSVYPIPIEHPLPGGGSTFTTGVHLSPTFQESPSGNKIVVSPLLVNPQSEKDYAQTIPLEQFYHRVHPFFPSLNLEDLHLDQSGISAKLKDHRDFVIEWDQSAQNCINLLGIDSPGATSALAIAMVVRNMIKHNYFDAQSYLSPLK